MTRALIRLKLPCFLTLLLLLLAFLCPLYHSSGCTLQFLPSRSCGAGAFFHSVKLHYSVSEQLSVEWQMCITPLFCGGFFYPLLAVIIKPRSLKGQSFVPCVKGLVELLLVSVPS